MNNSIKAADTTVSSHAMQIGLWLQHVHARAQNFFFAPGSFTHSFPVIALTTLAFVRQRRDLQCVSISLDFERGWSKVGPNGFLFWKEPDLMYIERAEASVYWFTHKKCTGNSKEYVCGQLGTSLGNISEDTREMEILLFSWLAPTGVTLDKRSLKYSNDILITPESAEHWHSVFNKINSANETLTKKHLSVQTDLDVEKDVPAILHKEEWTCKGELTLKVRPTNQ